MKVHVWSPGFAGFGGGITAFSREMARGLQRLGHEVRLIGKSDATGSWRGLPLTGAANISGPLQTPAFAAKAFLAGARHRPDYVISTHLNFGPVGSSLKHALHIPFALVAHGIDVNDRLSRTRRASLRGASQVIAVSEWTRQRVIGLGVEPARVPILANTFDEARFTVGIRPERLVQRYAIQSEEKILLTVARLDPAEKYKGYDRLVQALPAIRSACGAVRLLIVGRGADRERIEALAGEAGVSQSITFAGFVPDEELADHYRLADVFAMPSTGEGFGIVFLEAMACGTPVLGGDRDGSVDALDAGRLGCLVDPLDVGAIADGIRRLIQLEGPRHWFEKAALHDAVVTRFGRTAFQNALANIMSAPR